MASEADKAEEYILDEEEQALIENLLISLEYDEFPLCAVSAGDLSDRFAWNSPRNRKRIRFNNKFEY